MRIGIDCVDLERFRKVLARSPSFAARFFTVREQEHCSSAPDPVLAMASTFAAKEAVMKAAGTTPAVAFARRIEIVRAPSGAPHALLDGHVIQVSLSHDGPMVVAAALTTDPPLPQSATSP